MKSEFYLILLLSLIGLGQAQVCVLCFGHIDESHCLQASSSDMECVWRNDECTNRYDSSMDFFRDPPACSDFYSYSDCVGLDRRAYESRICAWDSDSQSCFSMSNSLSCSDYSYKDICNLAANCIYISNIDECVSYQCESWADEYSCSLVKEGGSSVDLCQWNSDTGECENGSVSDFDQTKCESYNDYYA